jgi:hypothetical protein
MTTVLVNQVGEPPATKRVNDRPDESPTVYEKRAIERRIKLLRSDDERLHGPLSYTGAQAASLREAAAGRTALAEAPRNIQ